MGLARAIQTLILVSKATSVVAVLESMALLIEVKDVPVSHRLYNVV